MQLRTWSWAAVLLLFAACEAQPKKVQLDVENNEAHKVGYSYGVYTAMNMENQGFEGIDQDAFMQGVLDHLNKDNVEKMLVRGDSIFPILQEYSQRKMQEQSEKEAAEGREFLERNKTKEGVMVTESGLQYEILKEGDGPMPTAEDRVTTHYHGTLTDGTVFDSSIERGEPATLPVSGVISGWTEALQMMKVGSKWRLYVPSELAYGQRGAGERIKPNATLIFDIELLAIEK